jgi:type VI secretion system secreted protein Hcp
MAVDYFLKVDGIAGESKDDKHKGEIDVLAFSWGVSNEAGPSGGGGGGAGKAQFQDLLVVARTSKASPKLWHACASGKHIKTAVLTARKSGGDQKDYLKIVIEEVLVTSFEVDGSDEEDPLDQVAFAYAKITTEYVPTDATGKPLSPVKADWDLQKTKA